MEDDNSSQHTLKEVKKDKRDQVSVVDLERQTDDEELLPPDGGYGWVIAIAAMLAVFSTWGSNASYGIFLNYYISAEVFPGATQRDYVLIGGIVMFLATGLAPLSSCAYRIFGAKRVIAVGVVLQTVGYILASFSTKLWQLFLTQGVLVGISFSLVFIPATSVLPTWFTTRKATSMGICISGAGLGGLIFSLSINRVIEQTGGHRWALRMVCFVALFSASVALFTLKPFNAKTKPLSVTLKKEYMLKSFNESCNLSIFYKQYELALVTLWFSLTQLAYIILLFTLAASASSIGLTSAQGSTLTSLVNASQVVGRPTMGLIADRVGRFNATAGISFTVGVLLLAFWTNALTYGAMIGFSVLAGLVAGVGSTMAMPLLSDLLGDEGRDKLDVAWGGINVLNSPFCLVAGVISISLTNKENSRPYLYSQIFAGSSFMLCFFTMLVLRQWVVHRALKEQVEQLAKLQELEELDDDDDVKSQQLKLERLSENTIRSFFFRMFYPMRI